MDVRDLNFWHKEAQKKSLRSRMSAIQACRLAFAKDAAYSEMMNELNNQLNKLEFGENRVINKSWQALRAMKKG